LNNNGQLEIKMAKKGTIGEAADAVKTVAGKALGAAAAAATGAVLESVTEALSKGGAELTKAGPSLQKSAARAVSEPIIPHPKRKSPAVKKRKAARGKAKRASSAAKKKHG
jgi:hypothetical protein